MEKESESINTEAAPKSGESEISEERGKGRRRRRPKTRFDSQNGDVVVPSTDKKTTGKGRPRSAHKREKVSSKSTTGTGGGSGNGGSGGGSVLFTVFVIGLVFSLIDVVYIIGFVDRQNLSEIAPIQARLPASKASTSVRTPEASADTAQHAPLAISSQPDYKSNGADDVFGDKSRIVSLLTRAGFNIDAVKDKELIDDLPTWSEVVSMYGPEPVLYGLDQCEKFQHQSDPALHFLGVAGTFNTGTNLMAELLIGNCHMQARMDKFGAQNRGIRWQVPWGKHTPPGDEEFRQSHKTEKDKNVDSNNILTAVTIRDPLVWLGSMCRHAYTAHWDHESSDHCPDFSVPDLNTFVKYNGFHKEHQSILHLWNDYYREYQEANFPRLIVRYEDLIFHPEEVTKTVCECAGGSMRRDGTFKYVVDSAKKGVGAHGRIRTGYADALVKYGSEKRRYEIYKHASDLEYIKDSVEAKLMQLMRYPYPDPTKANSK